MKAFNELLNEQGVESQAVKQAYAIACKQGKADKMTAELERIGFKNNIKLNDMKPDKKDMIKAQSRMALKASTEKILFKSELRDLVDTHKAMTGMNKQIILN